MGFRATENQDIATAKRHKTHSLIYIPDAHNQISNEGFWILARLFINISPQPARDAQEENALMKVGIIDQVL